MTWHADASLMTRYAGGTLDEAQASSLEAHLLRCAGCRRDIAVHVPAPLMDQVWDGVSVAIELPKPPLFEQGLLRAGLPDHVARLLGATRSLRLSWLSAVGLALAFAVGSARLGGDPLLFLAIAPLIPLAGVAAAFGPGVDPTYEVGLAAPMPASRLLLIRSIAVIATSTLLAGLAALALPRLDWTAAAWLLPSLGLASAGLALSSFWSPLRACGVVGAAWLAALGAAAIGPSGSLDVFGRGPQLGFAAAAVLGVAVLAGRRDAFERRRNP